MDPFASLTGRWSQEILTYKYFKQLKRKKNVRKFRADDHMYMYIYCLGCIK